MMDLEEKEDHVLFINGEGKLSSSASQGINGNDPTPQGPINEETGEINWDCPCLQSALKPPCGDFFRAAFSCFVASKTEPKGNDCMQQFSAMQDCFREHPGIYLKETEDEQDVNSVNSIEQQ
ncbi:hypothetical protein K2X05_04335 [bacterium]|nr:hypothetical protein [bacterium]